MFLQPGINVPQMKQAAEGIKYGTVMDPHKFPDPKQQGRVKVRTLELHGPGSAGMIPDSDLPWSQNESGNSFGNQEEMSSFGLPQKNSMMKMRHHGDSKYSPLVSGAPYSGQGKISEWTKKKKTKAGESGGGDGGGDSGGDDDFNQKDHYGHKDPLGNLYHADMKTKTLTIDHTKFSEVIWKLPKVTFDVQHTKWNRKKGTFEDGSPAQATMVGGPGGKQKDDQSGSQVDGDVTWKVAGKKTHTVHGDVTENYSSKQTTNVGQVHTVNDGSDHIHNVGSSGLGRSGGGSYTRKVADDNTVSGGKGRSDSYSMAWSAAAKNTAWSWLTPGISWEVSKVALAVPLLLCSKASSSCTASQLFYFNDLNRRFQQTSIS
jgi:hypothetical protein